MAQNILSDRLWMPLMYTQAKVISFASTSTSTFQKSIIWIKESPRKLLEELCRINFSISRYPIIHARQTIFSARCEDVCNLHNKMSVHQHIKIHILNTTIGLQMYNHVGCR